MKVLVYKHIMSAPVDQYTFYFPPLTQSNRRFFLSRKGSAEKVSLGGKLWLTIVTLVAGASYVYIAIKLIIQHCRAYKDQVRFTLLTFFGFRTQEIQAANLQLLSLPFTDSSPTQSCYTISYRDTSSLWARYWPFPNKPPLLTRHHDHLTNVQPP